jgi:hypothetical protein
MGRHYFDAVVDNLNAAGFANRFLRLGLELRGSNKPCSVKVPF